MSKVTYLIANFNNEEWVGNAIQSALKQTVKCNICVVDDGSSDNSINSIKNALFKDTAILPTIINDEEGYHGYAIDGHTLICLDKNHGPSYARNTGIKHTLHDTDYYAILDADDENYPDKIEKSLEILESDSNINIVYGDYDIFNTSNGNTLREFKKDYCRQTLLRECIIHSGSLIRKTVLHSVVEPTGWYDINLKTCEDWDLWLRMTERGLAYHIPESLSLVRSHSNDSSNSVPKETWQKNWQYVAEKTKMRLSNNAHRNK